MNKKIVFVCVFLIFIFYFLFKIFHFDIQQIDGGTLLIEESSPNGEYTFYGYMNDLPDTSIRGEILNNLTKKKKTIYYGYRESEFFVKWIDIDTINVNGRKLNINKDIYNSLDYE